MKGLEDSELILFFLSLSFQMLRILCSCYVRTIENIEFRSFFRSDEGLTLEFETAAHELVIFTLSTGHVLVLFFADFAAHTQALHRLYHNKQKATSFKLLF